MDLVVIQIAITAVVLVSQLFRLVWDRVAEAG